MLHPHNEIFSRRWCELLFEGRNRAYGAYRLRAELGRRYQTVVVVLLCLFAILLVLGFVYIRAFGGGGHGRVETMERLIEFDGVRLIETEPEAVEDLRAESGEDSDSREGGNGMTETQAEQLQPSDSTPEEPAFGSLASTETDGLSVDSIAQFPGGIRQFMQWLEQTLVYPEGSLQEGREGTVRVAFIVEPDGRVTDCRILESADTLMSREVLRALSKMPPWRAAIVDGKPQRSQITLPIAFTIS